MRKTRLYYPDTLSCDTDVQLNNTASTHLVRVLRARAGFPVILFNGNGKQYNAEVMDANPRKTTVHIINEQIISRESPLKITLIQGISRNDRMEICLQKATELGVHQIFPVTCERSSLKLDNHRQQKKQSHWQQIVISACEQSGRNTIPPVQPLQTLTEYLNRPFDSQHRFFLHPDASQNLKSFQIQIATPPADVNILIGPEGGLDEQEIHLLTKNHWQGIKMGPRVLRTETAGPAAIALLQLLGGDF